MNFSREQLRLRGGHVSTAGAGARTQTGQRSGAPLGGLVHVVVQQVHGLLEGEHVGQGHRGQQQAAGQDADLRFRPPVRRSCGRAGAGARTARAPG